MKVISFDNGVMVVGDRDELKEVNEPAPSFNPIPEQHKMYFSASSKSALDGDSEIKPNDPVPQPDPIPEFKPEIEDEESTPASDEEKDVE